MPKILIIDDDNDFRLMLRTLLSRAGYSVVESEDGLQGLEKYRKESPDLIVTDIVMPEQDGLGTIMNLVKVDENVKIIAVSGGGLGHPEDYLEMAKGLGANKVFSKPLETEDFLDTVKGLLKE